MFQMLANIFGYLLEFLYNTINNYGLAIILFTVIIKLLLLPLSIKQQRTMKKSSELQEKMKTIQFKYKNDPEKTGIPNSVSVLGGYGTSIATFLGLANDMKYLDGEGEEIVKGGGTNNLVMRPKELSKESKQLVYLTFMIDALALAGLGDQYISQINQ